jgi:short-subunit dehydrogenase
VAVTRLAGNVCLVTGATSGIGRAIAVQLARRGARVLVSGRDPVALEEVATATGGSALRADLAEPGAASRLAASALAEHGRVDVLVNCAGRGLHGPVAELDPVELDGLVRLNVTAPIELTRALLPAMLERRRGHIVNVGSVVGQVGRRNEAAYAATKAALAVFSESLAAELAGTGVAVTLVTPGVVRTQFFERRGRPYDRRWPRPVAAEVVAARVIGALESRRAEVVVPRWLTLPVRLRGVLPGLYRALARRFD